MWALGEVLPIHADVDQDARRTGQLLRRFDNIRRRALDHRNQIRQRNRRDQGIVLGNDAVGERQSPPARVDGHQFMVELQVSERHELRKVGHESALAGIPEVGDVVDLRSGRRQCAAQHFFEAGTIDSWDPASQCSCSRPSWCDTCACTVIGNTSAKVRPKLATSQSP